MSAVSERLRRLLQSAGPEAIALGCIKMRYTRAFRTSTEGDVTPFTAALCRGKDPLPQSRGETFRHERFIQRANDTARYGRARAAKRAKYNRLTGR